MRVGFGYDVHAFSRDRPLVIGGVQLPGPGLAGDSDADVLSHAIADALLGACALGDLGKHFPSSSMPEGGSSLQILRRVRELVEVAGFHVANVDATVVIEAVRLSSSTPQMVDNIASCLAIDPGAVSVKATTTDGLGTIGRGEGAAAYAVVLIENRSR